MQSINIDYSSAEIVKSIHDRVLMWVETEDGEVVLRNSLPAPYMMAVDEGRLESVMAQPMAGSGEIEFYPSIFDKAAVLAKGLICDHCFVDGNKRTGMTAAIVFLRRNGFSCRMPRTLLTKFAREIAIEKPEVAYISHVLESFSRRLGYGQLALPLFED